MPAAVFGVRGLGKWYKVSFQEPYVQLQLLYIIWSQRYQIRRWNGCPNRVTATSGLGYSQFCQYIGPTRPKDTVPHHLGRNLAKTKLTLYMRHHAPNAALLPKALPISLTAKTLILLFLLHRLLICLVGFLLLFCFVSDKVSHSPGWAQDQC